MATISAHPDKGAGNQRVAAGHRDGASVMRGWARQPPWLLITDGNAAQMGQGLRLRKAAAHLPARRRILVPARINGYQLVN